MKILFMTRHFGCLRNYEQAIHAFVARGHRMHLVAHVDESFGGEAMVARWAAESPAITFERLPEIPPRHWGALTPRLRLMLDYLRYLEPAYAGSPRLLERARRRTPRAILSITDRRWGRTALVRKLVSWLLRTLERAVPVHQEVRTFLKDQAADVVLFTPLIGLGSEEIQYLDATRPLGMRAVFCVWSWDNLTSKALLRTMPDLVTVWNDTQRREAVELHGAPEHRVCITGAQAFDHWFDRRPNRSRQDFCARVGLGGDESFLLWVCSALIKGSPPEAPFVRRWIEAIRASDDPVLRTVPILVRPHPSRLGEWDEVSLEGVGDVAFWGGNPIDTESRADYFDSLYHSTAVAGLNTSAFIEAAIVGRPVYTVLLPEFSENQEGTLHFHYLLTLEGGLLHAQRSLAAHLGDLAAALRAPSSASEKSRRFVERFVRPFGLDIPGSGRFVDAVERLGAQPSPQPSRDPFWTPVARSVAAAMARRAARGDLDRWLLSPQEAAKEERLRLSRIARKAGRDRARAEHREQYQEQKRQKLLEHRERKSRERAERQRMGGVGTP